MEQAEAVIQSEKTGKEIKKSDKHNRKEAKKYQNDRLLKQWLKLSQS